MRKPLRARNLQHRHDKIRLIAEKHEKRIADRLMTAFKALRQHVYENHVVRKADPENTARGVGDQILPREQVRVAVETALQGLDSVSAEAATVGMASAAAAAAVAQPPVSVLSAALHTALLGYRADLVKQVTDQTIDAITDVVQQGLTDGARYDEIARSVRPLIGLTTQQAAWVDSYAQGLADNDPAVMARAYHDARFDPTIQRAIEDDLPLESGQIDNMVENYANRALAGRATTIARTETLRAANIGAEAGVNAFLSSKGFDSNAMKRFWLVSLDELVCPICLSIPDANPDGVGMDEDFDSDDGPQYLPPDPHPNCRCTVSYQLDQDALALWRTAQDQAA